ncbi:hypothetical protein VTN02DRAFT_569 [Thermoascus thermophilus]
MTSSPSLSSTNISIPGIPFAPAAGTASSSSPSPSPSNPTSQTNPESQPPATTFKFPPTYSFPPFFTPQPNSATRHSQLQKWSALIQAWCRHHRLWKLSLVDAVETPLFHNAALRKRLSLAEARNVVDWMARGEEDGGGGRRAEWVSSSSSSSRGEKNEAWIWWRRPEEWAAVVADWVSGLFSLTLGCRLCG